MRNCSRRLLYVWPADGDHAGIACSSPGLVLSGDAEPVKAAPSLNEQKADLHSVSLCIIGFLLILSYRYGSSGLLLSLLTGPCVLRAAFLH